MVDAEADLMGHVPPSRVRSGGSVHGRGPFVLYWMHAQRRASWNFALDRAVEWAKALNKPLLVCEPLVCGGRWANDRHHRFVLEGMAENARRFERSAVHYCAAVEHQPGQVEALFGNLAARAAVVVADDFPLREPSRQIDRVARATDVRLERVDGCGLLPIRVTEQDFKTAFALRRFLQRELPNHLLDAPKANPLARLKIPRLQSLPRELGQRWLRGSAELLSDKTSLLELLPIDHRVSPVATTGGSRAARRCLEAFLSDRLPHYVEHRNRPQQPVTSGLSPYLHHGHISVHEIFQQLAQAEGWSPDRLAEKATGSREGWWGISSAAEAFLDELITWREVGLNMCVHRTDYDKYASLPDWARQTLADHAGDRGEHIYTLGQFERAATHDPLWNAAQGELLTEGRLHNYLRMLWGKKILQWSASPQKALRVMIELNNKYALDGQDPNSYSGIFWVLGRYDRPWGPERPIFGKIRYMSSENTARKVRVDQYIERYAPKQALKRREDQP